MREEKIFGMKFSAVYSALLNKVEKKGRTKKELDDLINWLCGYSIDEIQDKIKSDISYKTFFDEAPQINKNASLIKGKICGVRVEEIENKTMRMIRYLDKIVDELAKGKDMEKIKRK